MPDPVDSTEWTDTSLGEVCEERKERRGSRPEPTVLSVSKDHGIVPQSEIFNRRVASAQTGHYKLIRWGEFAYDPMLLWSGSIGRQTRVDEGILSPAYCVFAANETIADGRFLIRLLKRPQMLWPYAVISQGTNVRRQKAQFRDFCGLRVLLPPLAEQRQIAEILDTLDEAVGKTEAIIAKLKQVKQGLLHDLLTRGIDDNGELRDPERHPEQFKDSPLGRIPEGWQMTRLERWLAGRPKNGYSPQAVEEWTGKVMLGLGCLTEDGFAPVQLKNAPAGDVRLHKAALRDGDLLVSRANTRELVGLAGRYEDIGLPCSYPDLMMRLTPGSGTSGAFLELVLRSASVRRQMQAAASGTSGSMVKINGSIVCGLSVVMPTEHEQRRVVEATRQLTARLEGERHHCAKLIDLKRGLMEDLLAGRVRVTSLLEEAAE